MRVFLFKTQEDRQTVIENVKSIQTYGDGTLGILVSTPPFKDEVLLKKRGTDFTSFRAENE